MKVLVYLISLIVLLSANVHAFDFSFGYQRNGAQGVKAIKTINIGGVKEDQKDGLLDVIKGVANWVFGILALIALIILIYGGLQMVTSAGDEGKYNAGFTLVQQAATGLIIIGIARFVVSIAIWLGQQIGRAAEGSSAGTDQ